MIRQFSSAIITGEPVFLLEICHELPSSVIFPEQHISYIETTEWLHIKGTYEIFLPILGRTMFNMINEPFKADVKRRITGYYNFPPFSDVRFYIFSWIAEHFGKSCIVTEVFHAIVRVQVYR
jgi:hypothetical protein